MSSGLATGRLIKELREIEKKPLENIRARPLESNILEWHYVICGSKGSLYEGGWYHGVVTFPPQYPFKPPSIQMLTPNGRFKICTRLCLSMSDFHPETWNPMWSVGTILMGLYSFMHEDAATYGSIVTTDAFKRKAALESLEYNCKNATFASLFPDLVELHEEEKKKAKCNAAAAVDATVSFQTSSDLAKSSDSTSLAVIIGVFMAIVACTWALLNYLP